LLSPESSLTGAGVPWALRVVPSTAQELALLIGPGVTRVLGPDDRRIREIAADVRGLGRTSPEAPTSREVTVEPVPVLAGGGVSALQERADALLRTRPDTVLLWLDPGPAAAWAVALRRAGFRGRLAGPGSLRSAAFIRAAGSAADGFRVPDWEAGGGGGEGASALRAFVQAYRGSAGEEPDAAAVAAADAVGMAVALIRRAGDRPVHSVFPVGDLGGGLTGSWRFDRSGNRVGRLAVLEWMPSGWRPVVGASATGSGGVVRGAEP
jgi:hypothetical protein